ncbi:MAG TPA: hypothetical protein VMY41_06160 [Thermohalobaculum sp.]|nr:hypothetical protein [Thermohalobaculum sp.]
MPGWGIRVATDPSAGAGHVARCAALARALRAEAVFFVDPDCPDQSPFERNRWRIVRERRRDDASSALAALANAEVGGLVIDSYALPGDTVAAAAASGFTAVFRDGGARGAEHLTIDIGAAEEAADADVVAGPAYAPLAPCYADARRHTSAADREIVDRASILIAFGQHDSANLTAIALAAAGAVEPTPRLTCVLGASAPHMPAVEALIGSLSDAALLVSPADMIEIYLVHDLAIGAPGVSQLERMCCGLPSILMCQSAAQMPAAKAWQRRQCAELVDIDGPTLTAAASRLIADRARRRAMRQAGLSLVDGGGARRLAARLETALALQAAQSECRRIEP